MMKRLVLVIACGGFLSSAAIAAEHYEIYLAQQQQRGTEIEMIRVTSKKALVETEESDADVAKILDEAEALDEEISDHEETEEST